MALIHCHFASEVLGLNRSMDVILPHDLPPRKAAGRKAPVLWLLHGLSDDHTAWQRRTSIERYASERGLAVVMPSVDRGFYTDMAAGPRWWTHVSEELPRLVAAMFPVSARREETFVAGLSMGGYGAFKLALRQPRRFAAAASWRRKSMGRPCEICVDIGCCFPTGNLRRRSRARRGNAQEFVFFVCF